MPCVLRIFVVLVTLLVGLCMSKRPDQCGGLMKTSDVKIPVGMPIEDFDKWVVGQNMREVYFAIPSPPAFLPTINYNSTIVKDAINGRYIASIQGETLTPDCYQATETLTLAPRDTNARFISSIDSMLRVIWSSCPDKYIWSLRCTERQPDKIKRCPVSATAFGLYVRQTSMDDLPLDDIIQDLRRTGVRFGAADYKWFYVFGETTLC